MSGTFPPHHRVQISSGAHPASYARGTGESFPGVKAARGMKLTIHLQLVQRLRMHVVKPAFSQHVFTAWCLIEHKDNFSFTPSIQGESLRYSLQEE
jgi:hypothetical protein